MKITVKILLGEECSLEVASDVLVLELKKFIEETMNVPVRNQKLLLSGKTLCDEKKLSDYNIQEGTKLNLCILRNKDESTSAKSDAQQQNALVVELLKVLRQYCNEASANKITEEFMKQFHIKLSTLSLDDIERIATSYMQDEQQDM